MARSHTAEKIHLVAAKAKDISLLLPFVRAFYDHFSYPYDEKEKITGLRQIIRNRSVGRLWLIRHKGKNIGYVLLAFSFSLEFNGRIAFIDELFVEPSGRQKGVGATVLKQVENICVRLGIRTVRLEIEASNKRATALYARSGYIEHGRHLMSKEIKRKKA